jgi:predicted small lipoprotein YifL
MLISLALRLMWKLAGLAVLGLVLMTLMSGCGRKGALEAPNAQSVQADQSSNDKDVVEPKPSDDRIVLDKLLF